MGVRRYSIFTGSGSSVPERIVENEDFIGNEFFLDYGVPIDPDDNPRVVSKLQEITEISERRYAPDDLVASDLGVEAAEAALADSDTDPETLDYIIVAHNFGDVDAENLRLDLCPTLAARIKERLRIRNPLCVAYDLRWRRHNARRASTEVNGQTQAKSPGPPGPVRGVANSSWRSR